MAQRHSGGVNFLAVPVADFLEKEELARPERFELPALGSEDRCSIQLSYGRKKFGWRGAYRSSSSEECPGRSGSEDTSSSSGGGAPIGAK
jgi:hypothetical protein